MGSSNYNKPPCHNCEDRKQFCWNDCERYKRYKAMTVKAKKQKQDEKAVNDIIFGSTKPPKNAKERWERNNRKK